MTNLTTLKVTLRKGEASFKEAMNNALTYSQYQVLAAVRDAASTPNQFQLVVSTGIDRSTLSDVVRRLIAKQLLSRKRSRADERAWELYLTEGGLKLLAQAEKKLRPIEKSLTLLEAAE